LQPLVSIIIPTYNRAHLLGETLDSVMMQTYSNWECIVVDDGSTDATVKLMGLYCEKDSRIQYHHRPINRPKGANACRNFGFELSKGAYIQWFDSDDIIDSNILSKAIEIFQLNNKLDFVFFNYQVFDGILKDIIIKQVNKSEDPFIDYFRGKINLATPSVLWKKKAIIRNKFNETLKKSQELNFVFQLYKEGYNTLVGFYINENGFFLRKHSNSIVSKFQKAEPGYLYSNIFVRNEILEYFSRTLHTDVQQYNKSDFQRSLRIYINNSGFLDFLRILFKISCKNKSLANIKSRIFIYKIICIFSSRDYRLNRVISELYLEEFNLNLD